jgi:predicted component of type VI protein secretion system
MQTTRLLLLCFVALIVVMGCSSEKTASTENADTQQAPEAEVQEINLAVSGMT